MKAFLPFVIALWVGGAAFAQQSLIANGDFSAPDPLKGWRIDFPYQGQYSNNAAYCRVTTQLGRKCFADIGLAVHDGDARAFCRKKVGCRCTAAGCTAGNQCAMPHKSICHTDRSCCVRASINGNDGGC